MKTEIFFLFLTCPSLAYTQSDLCVQCRPPISSGPKSGDDESEADPERSPIETQVAFEVVDENEAFWKLFPTKTGVSSFDCGFIE